MSVSTFPATNEEAKRDKLKAITLWQPWATAMAKGSKRNETRGWETSYRGDMVICSAKRKPTRDECGDENESYQACLALPYGFALCVVEIYDCVPTQYFMRRSDRAKLPLRTITETEWHLGNYSDGRFAWLTKNLRELKTPVPVIGRQGFFFLSKSEIKQVREQL